MRIAIIELDYTFNLRMNRTLDYIYADIEGMKGDISRIGANIGFTRSWVSAKAQHTHGPPRDTESVWSIFRVGHESYRGMDCDGLFYGAFCQNNLSVTYTIFSPNMLYHR